jgi:radical SAM protein with 4Fe4S-binding SPASM domain
VYRENDDVIVNLTVTRRCYARCQGCINSAITFADAGTAANLDTDFEPQRDAGLINKIAEVRHSRAITLCFYGGEPFLVPDRMEKYRLLLSRSPAGQRIRYMVYTAGDLIGENIRRYPELIRSIWLYSVSIDGGHQQHARARPGTDLAKIADSLGKLREVHDGHVLFWSTLREEQSLLDCFYQFMRMYETGLVNHMFWHWADTPAPFEDIGGYAERYSQELGEVMAAYKSHLSKGVLLPLSHINELVLYLLTDKERGHTACGVELAQNFDILDGAVHACADLPASAGAVSRDGSVEIPEEKLKKLVGYKQELGCPACDAHFYCGGRCPVQALAGSRVRTRQICRLMRLHVGLVREHLDEIRRLLKGRKITHQQIYDRSAFITRYTDVVP